MPSATIQKEEDPLLSSDIGEEDSDSSICSTTEPCDITVSTKEGYSATLQPVGNEWQAMVQDNTFPGFHRFFTVPVRFSRGYTAKDLIANNTDWQRRYVQLLSTDDHTNIIYVGSTGLQGGGFFSFLASVSSSVSRSVISSVSSVFHNPYNCFTSNCIPRPLQLKSLIFWCFLIYFSIDYDYICSIFYYNIYRLCLLNFPTVQVLQTFLLRNANVSIPFLIK